VKSDMVTSDNLLVKKNTFWTKLWKQKMLLLMSLPFLIYVIIFRYLPVYGWLMAFQNYMPGRGLWHQTWVGFQNFKMLFDDPIFYLLLRNTLVMNTMKVLFEMFFSIILALMLNEVRFLIFKRVTQTISYLPWFISWVVAANLFLNALSADGGIVNQILLALHLISKPIMFMGIPKLFWWIIAFTDTWKNVGYGAIIYLASMTAINPNLYEAATIDGASRLQRIRYITLPALKPVIVILLIINIGQVLNMGYEQVYLMSNGRVIDYSRIFTLYAVNYGLKMMRYSYVAAIGIFRSVISLILVFGANYLAKRMGEEGVM
jgi:putative aldouronate transport system permease protein